ncbi:MAG: hypothetical protein HQK51_18530 [Oligoflexia bacterium]|nr:hypothetical protein [Oligoflexia bacterium]
MKFLINESIEKLFICFWAVCVVFILSRFVHFNFINLPSCIEKSVDFILTLQIVSCYKIYQDRSNMLLILNYISLLIIVLILAAKFNINYLYRIIEIFLIMIFLFYLQIINLFIDINSSSTVIFFMITFLMIVDQIKTYTYRKTLNLIIVFGASVIILLYCKESYLFLISTISIGIYLSYFNQSKEFKIKHFFISLILLLSFNALIDFSLSKNNLLEKNKFSTSSSYDFCYSKKNKLLFLSTIKNKNHPSIIQFYNSETFKLAGEINVLNQLTDSDLKRLYCTDDLLFYTYQISSSHDYFNLEKKCLSYNSGDLVGIYSIKNKQNISQCIASGLGIINVPTQNKLYFTTELWSGLTEYFLNNMKINHYKLTIHENSLFYDLLHSIDSLEFMHEYLYKFHMQVYGTNLNAYNADKQLVYLLQLAFGSNIIGIDYRSNDIKIIFQTYNGYNHSIIADQKYNRLIISGMWGIDVLDSNNYKVIFRKRTGFDVREAILDDKYDLIYVPNSIGLYLYVFGRKDLNFLGRIFTGGNSRGGIIVDDYLVLANKNGSFSIRRDSILTRI